jgi:uncharacterized protein
MSIEDNKAVVKKLFENFTTTQIDQALDLVADDAMWTLVGEPRRFHYAGSKTKAAFAEQIKGFFSFMAKFRWVPNVITAEEDRVSVEAESFGESADGKKYHNFYHMMFVVKDGKIRGVREYMDPFEVLEFTGEMTFPK